jgi:hypothetical protein
MFRDWLVSISLLALWLTVGVAIYIVTRGRSGGR